MTASIPPLRTRLIPFVVAGYAIAALRLAIDFWDREAAMWFGLYYAMPVVILWIGVTRRWGLIGWKQMAVTMLVAAPLVFGVCTVIAYTVGQFMEWTDGRFYPGEPVELASGEIEWQGGRTAPVRDTALAKVGVGLVHGLITSVIGTAWCIFFGTLFVWVYRRPASAS